jgi:predicted nucleotidyltransferase
VFGSVARGEDHPGSDLDLIPATDLKPGVRERVEQNLVAL